MFDFIFIASLAFISESNFDLVSILFTLGISGGTVALSALGYGFVIRKGVMKEVEKVKAELSIDIGEKVDRTVFEAHQKDNEKQHEDIIYVRTQVDEIKTILIKQGK